MRADIVMPKMGESIQEGKILRWAKKVGEPIRKDETILEISTDKVDSEIPSPVGGIVAEIVVAEQVFVLFGIFRYLFLIRQKKTDDNPMHVLITDLPLMLNIIAWFAACVVIIYAKEIHSWLRWI